MVAELARDGTAVLWSTAYLDEAERCDAVVVLNDGRVEFAGPPRELTRRVAGRSYRLLGMRNNRRDVLAEVLNLESVGDGIVQGDAVRIVLRDRADMAQVAAVVQKHGGVVQGTAPRFEDAFVDLLGGGPGGMSSIAQMMDPVDLGTDIAVSCHRLTKRFGDFVATDDVTFEVGKGEIFGLLGPNGAGKSTTFKMLCGLLKPSSGEARVAGLAQSRVRHACGARPPPDLGAETCRKTSR